MKTQSSLGRWRFDHDIDAIPFAMPRERPVIGPTGADYKSIRYFFRGVFNAVRAKSRLLQAALGVSAGVTRVEVGAATGPGERC